MFGQDMVDGKRTHTNLNNKEIVIIRSFFENCRNKHT